MLPTKLLSRLQQIIEIVNVKTSALNTTFVLGFDHECLLFWRKVHWMSRRNMTRKAF